MSFLVKSKNDNTFLGLYRFSWILLLIIGSGGILALSAVIGINLDLNLIKPLLPNLGYLLMVFLGVSFVTFIVGLFQVVFTSFFGEEIILFVTWSSPFVLIGLSGYLYFQQRDTNILIIGGMGVLFLLIFYYMRNEIRLSAKLTELSAEMVRDNLSMEIPQIRSFLLRLIITILLIPGVILIFGSLFLFNPILGVLVALIFLFFYMFVLTGIQTYADALNVAYSNQWYSGKPSQSKASSQVAPLKAGIIKFAFLLTIFRYISMLSNNKDNRSGFIFRGITEILEFLGTYTLVLMVIKKTTSLSDAYVESTKSVFKMFKATSSGSLGFAIIDFTRWVLSAAILLGAGWYFASIMYSDQFLIWLVASIITIFGLIPLNSMFKPVVNTFRLILYRSYTGDASSKFNKEIKGLLKTVKKKKSNTR